MRERTRGEISAQKAFLMKSRSLLILRVLLCVDQRSCSDAITVSLWTKLFAVA